MKQAVAYLEPKMEKKSGNQKGTIVLATVKGDVHDIGKNLVDIILTNNGYRVINLGIKQPLTNILNAAREHRADAIGMSGLLTLAFDSMRETVQLLREHGQDLGSPVIVIGGSTIDEHVAGWVGADHWTNDAMEGVRICQKLLGNKTPIERS